MKNASKSVLINENSMADQVQNKAQFQNLADLKGQGLNLGGKAPKGPDYLDSIDIMR